jgi:hypothetical protein
MNLETGLISVKAEKFTNYWLFLNGKNDPGPLMSN